MTAGDILRVAFTTSTKLDEVSNLECRLNVRHSFVSLTLLGQTVKRMTQRRQDDRVI